MNYYLRKLLFLSSSTISLLLLTVLNLFFDNICRTKQNKNQRKHERKSIETTKESVLRSTSLLLLLPLIWLTMFGSPVRLIGDVSAITTLLDPQIDPDELRTFDQLIASRGYRLQTYYAMTPDGYILTVDRVVTPDFDPFTYNVRRRPVIAFHGIFTDSTIYYHTSPFLTRNNSFCGDNFGFCMLRSGRYDLWVPNARGNGRSMRHIRFDASESAFWRFSWDQIAEYDLPTIIKLVRRTSASNGARSRTIPYVGYSQGGATILALLSMQPQYAQIIRPLVLWAPAVYVGRAQSVLGVPLRRLHSILRRPGPFVGVGNPTLNHIMQWHICRSFVGRQACAATLRILLGDMRLNATRIPTWARFTPNPSSNWQVAHFGQNGESGRFRRFTYPSTIDNVRKYGSPIVPEYPLHRIPAGYPVMVMYGATDAVVDPGDVRQLIGELRRYRLDVVEHLVREPAWSHGSFFVSLHSGKFVYDPTLRYIDRHVWPRMSYA